MDPLRFSHYEISDQMLNIKLSFGKSNQETHCSLISFLQGQKAANDQILSKADTFKAIFLENLETLKTLLSNDSHHHT